MELARHVYTIPGVQMMASLVNRKTVIADRNYFLMELVKHVMTTLGARVMASHVYHKSAIADLERSY